MRLGECADGRTLTYDEFLCEFSIGGTVVPYSGVLDMDDRGLIRWLALEQRDWLRGLDAVLLAQCREEARANLGQADYGKLSPHEKVLADAARDDGVLAGELVDADPALVRAVADRIEGLIASGELAGGGHVGNPLAAMELPEGMEALSQLERADSSRRRMTRSERRLMKRILKQNDKEKAKREKNSPTGSLQAEAEPEAG